MTFDLHAYVEKMTFIFLEKFSGLLIQSYVESTQNVKDMKMTSANSCMDIDPGAV